MDSKILLKIEKSTINSTKLLLELCYYRPVSMDHGGLSEKEKKEGKNTDHHMPIKRPICEHLEQLSYNSLKLEIIHISINW